MSILSSREKKIILLLLNTNKDITIQTIGDELGVSRRTILRAMPSVYDWFLENGHQVIKNQNKGLSLNLTMSQKETLKSLLDDEHIIQIYTKHERQLYIITELLQSKEPLKLYYFSYALGVSEATISHDLNDSEKWLSEYDLTVERKQGHGIEVLGRERSKRKALINILYEMLDGQQLKNVVNKQLGVNPKPKVNDIKSRLLNMIDVSTINIIEDAISISEDAMGFKFAESSYTALAVHLALAIQRINNGEKITVNPEILENTKLFNEYVVASQLTSTIEERMDIFIPEDEIAYVTMHLRGAKYKNGLDESSVIQFNERIISNYQLTMMINEMIQVAEEESGYPLKKVDSLLIGLVDHLRPAINRLQMKLDIRNPLLKKIKDDYADIYDIAIKCSEVITKHFGFTMPESEVGYIALHIGSAIEQIKNKEVDDSKTYNVVVTCISGIGASKMLAERIKAEFSNLNIVDVLATTNIKNNWLIVNEIDLIISTVYFDHDFTSVVAVNPLLPDNDIEKINQKLKTLSVIKKSHLSDDNISTIDYLKTINEYSSAIIEIIEQFSIVEDMEFTHFDDLLKFIASDLSLESTILHNDLLNREEMGTIVFPVEKVKFLHARSSAVDSLKVVIYRIKTMLTTNEEEYKTVFTMVAPKEVSNQRLEVIGELSSRLVSEESLLSDVTFDNYDILKAKFEEYLIQFFSKKTGRKK